MNHKKINVAISWIWTAISAMLIVSCAEEVTDARDQAVGDYNYTVRYYTLDNGTLRYYGPEMDNSGTMVVSKSWRGLEGIEGNIMWFTAEKVRLRESGLGFNLRRLKQDGVMISGYSAAVLPSRDGPEIFEGAYNSDARELRFYVQFPMIDGTYEWVVVAEVIAVKQ